MKLSSYFDFVLHERSQAGATKLDQPLLTKLLLLNKTHDGLAIGYKQPKNRALALAPIHGFGTEFLSDSNMLIVNVVDTTDDKTEEAFWRVLYEQAGCERELSRHTTPADLWHIVGEVRGEINYAFDVPTTHSVMTEGFLRWMADTLRSDAGLDESLGAVTDCIHQRDLLLAGHLGRIAGMSMLVHVSDKQDGWWLFPPDAYLGVRFTGLPPFTGNAFAVAPAFARVLLITQPT